MQADLFLLFFFFPFFFYSTSCLSAAGRTRKMPLYYSCWTVLPHPSGNRTPIFLKGIVFLLSTHTSISSRAGDSGQASQNVSVPWQQWPAVPGSVSPEWTNESQSSTGVAREPCENGRSEVMFRRIESWVRGRSWPPEVEGHPPTSCWRENNIGNRRGEKQGGPRRALDAIMRSYSNVFNRGGVEDWRSPVRVSLGYVREFWATLSRELLSREPVSKQKQTAKEMQTKEKQAWPVIPALGRIRYSKPSILYCEWILSQFRILKTLSFKKGLEQSYYAHC